MNGTSYRKGKATRIAIIGSIFIALIMVLGTFWIAQSARKDNERAVRTVSLLYLNELAGRRTEEPSGRTQCTLEQAGPAGCAVQNTCKIHRFEEIGGDTWIDLFLQTSIKDV